MRRWCVGDECWSFVFDESAEAFVPGFVGFVLGVQSTSMLVGGITAQGTLCYHLHFGERVFRSAADADWRGVPVGEPGQHRHRTSWLPAERGLGRP